MARDNSFEKFYFERVALGESCGCAEQVIATRELEERARTAVAGEGAVQAPATLRARLARLFGRQCAPDDAT